MSDNKQNENKIEHHQIELPKGGGAIRGIGEKFQANVATGTGGYSIPLPATPGRGGFAPAVGLGYDSGAGNSPFGLGWRASAPEITRKTSRELPQYRDYEDSDTFILGGAEDLVPYLNDDGSRRVETKIDDGVTYTVHFYRPRTEGGFSKIERWVAPIGVSHWRVTTSGGGVTIYGKSDNARLSDPTDATRVFKWQIEESYDIYGNRIEYHYKKDTETIGDRAFTQSYLKKVLYSPLVTDKSQFHFQMLFDYGEHDSLYPTPMEDQPWSEREDSFSSFRAGFEVRTRRLCNRVLMFHNFSEIGADWKLVRATELTYEKGPTSTYLTSAVQRGYLDEAHKTTAPLHFTYSRPTINPVVQKVDEESLKNLPVGLDNRSWQWIDLYGEGIPGIAVRQNGTIYYKENRGNATFGPLHPAANFPNLNASAQILLSDIDGDGNNEFTVRAGNLDGYYRYEDDQWQQFTPFKQRLNINWNDPNLKMLDLNGDGRADVLISEDNLFRWYPSKGEEGYEASKTVLKALDEKTGPKVVFADAEQTIYTADMSGDGLTDIVRIRNGEVSYWPNLGYGKFGAKIIMKNSPRFEPHGKIKQQYIKLGDIDGSGTTDILYFGDGRVRFWFNQSGNSFSEEQLIKNYMPIDSLSSVSLIDIKGTGTLSLVWSSNRPGVNTMQMSYIDLMTEKPHLLVEVDNSMGNKTKLHYTTSTEFYLDDKFYGTPWITKLLFPVSVLEKVETIDQISKSSLTTEYVYHHGFYDAREREFRGFGMVETIDTELFDETDGTEGIEYVKPIHTKQWFHTGSLAKQHKVSKQYETEYFQGDSEGWSLTDSVIENRENMSALEVQQAYRALRSSALRSEVYEFGAEVPYTVSESNGSVRMVQPKANNKYAVFMTVPNESLSFNYEQDATDPRVSHSCTVEVNEYGQVTKSASVVYPRRVPQHPEQDKMTMMLSTTEVVNRDDNEMFLLGVPKESKSYHIGHQQIYDKRPLTREEIISICTTALYYQIPFSQKLSGLRVQARLLSWNRTFFWNEEQNAPLPNGQFTKYLLMHHAEAAILDDTLREAAYGNKISRQDIIDAGYWEKDDYYWNPGLIQHYRKGNYYLPTATEDRNRNTVEVFYDDYSLVPIRTKDSLDNEVQTFIDYRTLQPTKMIDPNGNTSEAIFDPLGMVIATTMYGDEMVGENPDGSPQMARKGDANIADFTPIIPTSLAEVVNDPLKFIQGASSFVYYDMDAWSERQEPLQSISVARKKHVSELLEKGEVLTKDDCVISLGYSDGFGRNLQSKVQMDPGEAWVKVGNTFEKRQIIDRRWLTSGRTVYNNKEQPIKQYEPFYSSTFQYEDEEFFHEYGVTSILHYDTAGRVIRTDLPDGNYTKVEFDSWQVTSYDQNDTNPSSPHYNTPSTVTLDSLGREFRVDLYMVDKSIANPANEGEILTTKTEFDITGKPLSITDPRLAQKGVNNYEGFVYDMAGNTLYSRGVDAGENWVFANIMGNPIKSFDKKGYVATIEYDILHRPIAKYVSGDGLNNNKVEEIAYISPTTPYISEKNLRGQILYHKDAAGMSVTPAYGFKGNPLSSSYSLRELPTNPDGSTNYREVDLAVDNTFSTEVFTSRAIIDSLGRPTEVYNVDESITRFSYKDVGTLEKVSVQLKDQAEPTEYVTDIQYDEKGQRELIKYGNGTETHYTYDEKTFRMMTLQTMKSDSGALLQDISYTYDPVGNITEIIDNTHQKVYTQNQIVEAKNTFVYDALYRLKEATGREHHTLPANAPQHGEEWFNARKTHVNDLQKSLNYRRSYEYDLGNNLTRMQHFSADGTRNYSRNITVSETSNRAMPATALENGKTVEEFFDVNGNLKSLDHLKSLEWNYSNNIAKAVVIERDGDVDDAEYYIYDASGNRVRKITETKSGDHVEKRETIYLGGIEVKRTYHHTQATPNVLKKERVDHHVSDGGSRIAIINHWTKNELSGGEPKDTIKVRYQYSNHLGSASLELDESGGFISYQEYFPFGETAYTLGEVSTEYRYTGKERDEFTGLYYFGARYYAPWMFRWMNPDPSGPVDGLNVFVYCGNMPITLTDPDGRESKPVTVFQEQHHVSKGDTLNKIAKSTGVTVKDILDVNPSIKNPNSIQAGALINLPIWHFSTDTTDSFGRHIESMSAKVVSGEKHFYNQKKRFIPILNVSLDSDELNEPENEYIDFKDYAGFLLPDLSEMVEEGIITKINGKVHDKALQAMSKAHAADEAGKTVKELQRVRNMYPRFATDIGNTGKNLRRAKHIHSIAKKSYQEANEELLRTTKVAKTGTTMAKWGTNIAFTGLGVGIDMLNGESWHQAVLSNGIATTVTVLVPIPGLDIALGVFAGAFVDAFYAELRKSGHERLYPTDMTEYDIDKTAVDLRNIPPLSKEERYGTLQTCPGPKPPRARMKPRTVNKNSSNWAKIKSLFL